MATVRKETNKGVSNKLVVITICVLLFILIPVIILLFDHKLKSPSPSQNTVIRHSESAFSIAYPNNWKESESGVPEGDGEVVYLQPPNADPTVKPHVLLKITDATQENISRMNISYKLLKYQKADVMVSGVGAQKYTQILQGVNGPFHSMSYVFIVKEKLYLLELGYTQKNADPALENEFNQIVNNFTLR
jgi:hypothetical protein